MAMLSSAAAALTSTATAAPSNVNAPGLHLGVQTISAGSVFGDESLRGKSYYSLSAVAVSDDVEVVFIGKKEMIENIDASTRHSLLASTNSYYRDDKSMVLEHETSIRRRAGEEVRYREELEERNRAAQVSA